MKLKIDTYSFVTDEGKLAPATAKLLKEGIPKFAGKRLHLVIEEVKNTRSALQNNYYWGGVVNEQIDCFAERWGTRFTKNQVHGWNLINIWQEEVVNEDSGEILVMPGTSVVDVAEFEIRLERLRQFFWEKFDWQIPLPETQIDLNFGNKK